MRSPKDFFKPARRSARPQPVREIPFRPSRMIHFFDPSNEKMAAKVPADRPDRSTSCSATSRTPSPTDKEAARAGLVKIAKSTDFGDTQLWTRVNSLDSPWVLDDLTTLVGEIGDKLDVIMIPKVEGAEDIHYVDRLLAQLEARAGLKRAAAACTPSSRRRAAWPTSRRSAPPAPACRACRSARPTWPRTAA